MIVIFVIQMILHYASGLKNVPKKPLSPSLRFCNFSSISVASINIVYLCQHICYMFTYKWFFCSCCTSRAFLNPLVHPLMMLLLFLIMPLCFNPSCICQLKTFCDQLIFTHKPVFSITVSI